MKSTNNDDHMNYNHLTVCIWFVFQEVNELLQKVSGTDRPVPIWADREPHTVSMAAKNQILYSFHFRLKVSAINPVLLNSVHAQSKCNKLSSTQSIMFMLKVSAINSVLLNSIHAQSKCNKLSSTQFCSCSK